MESLFDYTRFVVALLAILEPFGVVPIYLALTAGNDAPVRRGTARTAAVTTFLVLVVAAFSGDLILTLLGTSLDAFRVGGGIVLLLMAVSMLGAKTSPVHHTPEEAAAGTREAIGVVPIGIPLLAGPGAISTTIIQMERGHGPAHAAVIVLCLALICVVIWIVLRLAAPIGRTARRGRAQHPQSAVRPAACRHRHPDHGQRPDRPVPGPGGTADGHPLNIDKIDYIYQ